MNPEERIASYQEAVDVLNNYVAQEAAKIGNSQASLGLMAERVARPSGTTSGLANYTYDRTLRPTLDSLAASLTTTGYSQGLEKQLYDALTAAKNRYEDAKNRYTVASTTPRTTNTNKLNIDTNNGDGSGNVSTYQPGAGQIMPNTDYVSDYQDPNTGQWYQLTSPNAIDAIAVTNSLAGRNPSDGVVVSVNGKNFRYIAATDMWYQQTPSAGPNTYSARAR